MGYASLNYNISHVVCVLQLLTIIQYLYFCNFDCKVFICDRLFFFYITFYYLKVEFTWKGKFSPTKGYNITLLELYEADDLNDFDDFILFFSVGFLHFKTSPIYFSCLRE